MSSIKNIEKEIKANVIFEFFTVYCELETIIKKHFQKALKEVMDNESSDKNIIKKLYFYHGIVNEVRYVDFEATNIIIKPPKFNPQEAFNNFTINQIIKLDEKEKFIAAFSDRTVESLDRKILNYPFHSSIKKLIQMRNDLAHNFSKDSYGQNAKIEESEISFSRMKEIDEKQQRNLFQYERMDESARIIYGNILHIRNIVADLEKEL